MENEQKVKALAIKVEKERVEKQNRLKGEVQEKLKKKFGRTASQ
jgi:hypothetical protein